MTDGARADAALRANHLTIGRGNEPSGAKSFFPRSRGNGGVCELCSNSIKMQ